MIADRIKEKRVFSPEAGQSEAAFFSPEAGPVENENHSHLNENENHSHLGNFYPRRNTTLIYFFFIF